MRQTLRETMHRLTHTPPEGAVRAVFVRIREEKARRDRRYARIVGAFAVLSSLASIAFFGVIIHEVWQSEFPQYLSLAFSDSGIVLSSWQGFAALLVGALPLTEIAIAGGTLLLSLGLIRSAVRTTRKVFLAI